VKRTAILIVVFVFIVAFGYATARDAATHGINVVNVLALLVLALMFFGVVGALLQPPRE